MSTHDQPLVQQDTSERRVTTDAVREYQEVKAAIQLARECPRNESAAFASLMRACQRPAFAEEANYKFPRGGSSVEGPSVQLARAFARVWGNFQYGFTIIYDDDRSRTLRGFAWDTETNTRIVQEDAFEKLIYRKDKGWVEPDERDLRELTNRRGAIAVRNCILQLLPSDFIEDARNACYDTMKNKAKSDPEAAKKNLILAFSRLNIPITELEQVIGHSVDSCSPDELVELRSIWKSISDGNSRWHEYINPQTVEGGDRKVADKTKSKLNRAMEIARSATQPPSAASKPFCPACGKQECPCTVDQQVAAGQAKLEQQRASTSPKSQPDAHEQTEANPALNEGVSSPNESSTTDSEPVSSTHAQPAPSGIMGEGGLPLDFGEDELLAGAAVIGRKKQ